jgi:hypothetical protein
VIFKKITIFILLLFASPLANLICDAGDLPCYDLLIIDGQGRQVGYSPNSGNVVEEIPQGTYTREAPEDLAPYNWLDIGMPHQGIYILYIIGKDTGTYSVSINAFDQKSNATQQLLKGNIHPGEIKKMCVNYTPVVGGITKVFEDETPPITTFITSGLEFEVMNTAYISSSTALSFNAYDPVIGQGASGVNYTQYAIDGGAWQRYTSSFTITTDGPHTIQYNSVDNAGNSETIHTINIVVTSILDYVLAAAQNITLCGKSDIAGNIRSNSAILIQDRATVEGTVIGNSVQVLGKATVQGGIIQNAAPINMTPFDVGVLASSATFHNNNALIPVTWQGQRPIDSKGRLFIHDKDTLILSTGTYYFTGMDFTGKSSIQSNGPVTIVCAGDIHMLGNTNVNTQGSASHFAILVTTPVANDPDDETWTDNDSNDFNIFNTMIQDSNCNICCFDDLKIDTHRMITSCKNRSDKNAVIHIGGIAQINAIIYAPLSRVCETGNICYKGTIDAREISITGNGTITPIATVAISTTTTVLARPAPIPPTKPEGFTKSKELFAAAMVNADPDFVLHDLYAYPNPARNVNPKIHVELGIADEVEIRIYNTAGELVHSVELPGGNATIMNGKYAYEYAWNTSGIASGVYIYLVRAKKDDKTIQIMKKVALLK